MPRSLKPVFYYEISNLAVLQSKWNDWYHFNTTSLKKNPNEMIGFARAVVNLLPSTNIYMGLHWVCCCCIHFLISCLSYVVKERFNYWTIMKNKCTNFLALVFFVWDQNFKKELAITLKTLTSVIDLMWEGCTDW